MAVHRDVCTLSRPVVLGDGRGAAMAPPILADPLNLSQPGGADYVYYITTQRTA